MFFGVFCFDDEDLLVVLSECDEVVMKGVAGGFGVRGEEEMAVFVLHLFNNNKV